MIYRTEARVVTGVFIFLAGIAESDDDERRGTGDRACFYFFEKVEYTNIFLRLGFGQTLQGIFYTKYNRFSSI